jgi:hypothetical protein
LNIKDLKHIDIHEEFNYRGLPKVMEKSINDYKKIYEKYKNTAKEYNIDLFFCDMFVNEVCADVANNFKKPLVTFTTFLYRNYK